MVPKLDFDIKIEYFNHLVDTVVDKKHPRLDYIPLLDLLHKIPFELHMQEDEDRVKDGQYLRDKWCSEEGIYEHLYEFEDEKVSVLEVLVALAERLSFQIGNNCTGDHGIPECFWEILGNLGIEKYSAGNYIPLNIKEKVRVWMYRRYRKDGLGGAFPLQNSRYNQKNLTIWDQMNAYILEKYW